MSKKQKALLRLRQNPKHVRFSEIEKILLNLGFTKRHDSTSHAIFRKGCHIITISHHQSFINKASVIDVLEVLEEMGDIEVDD